MIENIVHVWVKAINCAKMHYTHLSNYRLLVDKLGRWNRYVPTSKVRNRDICILSMNAYSDCDVGNGINHLSAYRASV